MKLLALALLLAMAGCTNGSTTSSSATTNDAPATSAVPSATTSSSASPSTADASAPPATGTIATKDAAPLLSASLALLQGAPGMGALVLRSGSVVALGVTGVRKVGDPTPLTVNDRFQLNDDAEALTATLAALLIEDGKLTWDSTLGDVLAGMPMHALYKSTSLKDLLAQRAGAPASIPAADVTNARASTDPRAARAATVQDLLTLGPSGAQGTFVRSPASVLLANAMLEQVAGQAWEPLIAARLFAPLGMTSCASMTSDAGSTPSVPWGHTVADDGTMVPAMPGGTNESPAAFAPALGLRCSLQDWGRFLSLHLAGALGPADADATQLLPATSFVTLQTPIDFADAPAWNVVSRAWAGHRQALNAGGQGTSSTTLSWILPDKRTAIVVAVNEGGPRASKLAERTMAKLVGQFANANASDAGMAP